MTLAVRRLAGIGHPAVEGSRAEVRIFTGQRQPDGRRHHRSGFLREDVNTETVPLL